MSYYFIALSYMLLKYVLLVFAVYRTLEII